MWLVCSLEGCLSLPLPCRHHRTSAITSTVPNKGVAGNRNIGAEMKEQAITNPVSQTDPAWKHGVSKKEIGLLLTTEV